MGHANLILRLAALASSLLMIGGYVAFRAGAFDRPLPAVPAASTPAAAPADALMMGGSKSVIMVQPGTTQAAEPPLTILPGSKYMSLAQPVTPNSTVSGKAPNQSAAAPVLPGPKSAPVFQPTAPPK